MDRVRQHQEKLVRDLHQTLKRKEGSTVFSPFSVGTLMTMLHAGTAGSTAEQISRALDMPTHNLSQFHGEYSKLLASLQSQSAVELAAANIIYVQRGHAILEEFSKVMTGQFLGAVKSVDFGDAAVTSALVNGDVRQMTRGRIRDLVEENSLDGSTRVALFSAVYFRGVWRVQFPQRRTRRQEFHISSSSTSSVNMMQLDGQMFFAACLPSLQCQMLELPYKGDRFSMLLLLPKVVDGLPKLEDMLAATSLCTLRSQLRQIPCFIRLPRFRVETTTELLKPLVQLGVVDVFRPGMADLSRLLQDGSMFVSMVTQTAFIEVNEEGAEAAAATVCTSSTFRVQPPSCCFIADHPFLFALFDRESKLVLFSGRYAGPE